MPPRPDVSAERRAQIIEAALACFTRKGYTNTAMDDIVAESGLSKGAIHHYFKTKEDILLAAFRELDLKLYSSVDSKLKDTKDIKDFLGKRIEGPFELVKMHDLAVVDNGIEAAPEYFVLDHHVVMTAVAKLVAL